VLHKKQFAFVLTMPWHCSPNTLHHQKYFQVMNSENKYLQSYDINFKKNGELWKGTAKDIRVVLD
jgi:hypothetical protein